MAKVITIPASLAQHTSLPLNSVKKRRVAAYARVSTDHEEQQTSYEAQISYYTDLIHSKDDWEFVNVYSDEGITGCNTRKRDGFNTMIADGLAGKYDLLITKSISRFARNTVDTLVAVRSLKEKGVEVFFEKENIWTLDSKGELLITIMSSLAQEESRSISENCIWGQRKRFADGKVTVPFGRFLGYDRGADGNLVLNEEEAVIVRRIYGMFLRGMTCYRIAAELMKEGVPAPGGQAKWYARTIQSILQNEKYIGDALLQKTYTVDFLTKKKKPNEGELPQYYVQGNHEAIIPRETFEQVQQEIEQRNRQQKRSGSHVFSGKVRCGQCGTWYGSKTWHSNQKCRKVIWRCNAKYDGAAKCHTPTLMEKDMQWYAVTAINQLVTSRQNILTTLRTNLGTAFGTEQLEQRKQALEDEIQSLYDSVQAHIAQNARVAQDQTEYNERYERLSSRYEQKRRELDEVVGSIADRAKRKFMAESFLREIERQEDILTEFEPGLWYSLVDHMTVFSADEVMVTFKNGMEVTVGSK